ncbi:MAG: signal peptidase II [Alphaproteobacteria bacterium]
MLRLGLVLAALVVALDQIVKSWAIAALSTDAGRVEVTPFFNLVMVWNRGVSFGFLGDAALPAWVLAAFAALVAAALVVWLARVHEPWLGAGIGLIVGGAVGNVIDRLARGAVADFFDFHLGVYHWPAFNVADAAITVGVGILIIDSLLIRRKKHK